MSPTADVVKIAQLAQLELTAEETRTFSRQLDDVLGYIGELKSVSVEGVEPLLHPFEPAPVFRDDVIVDPPKDAEGKPKVLSSAPESLYDGFKVPQIL